jgi:transposase-like protein
MIKAFKEVCNYGLTAGAGRIDAGIHPCDTLALKEHISDPGLLSCPSCMAKGKMRRFAGYGRHFIYISGGAVCDTVIGIDRYECSSCGHTHALLPLAVVPHLSYSITFIASLLVDWLDKAYASIESLASAYNISTNTFIRLRQRFFACLKAALGISSGTATMRRFALGLLACGVDDISDALWTFSNTTGRFFMEAVKTTGHKTTSRSSPP